MTESNSTTPPSLADPTTSASTRVSDPDSVASAGAPEAVSVDRRSAFIGARTERWNELRAVASGKANLKRSPDDLRRIGALYRATSADLAIARRVYPSDPMINELELLITPARAIVYRRPSQRFDLRSYYRDRYWQRIGERPWLLVIATLLLLVPTLAVFVWALRDPNRAASLLGGRFSGGRETWGDQGYSASQQANVSSSIFVNNIRVSLLAFAFGITAGLGTAYLLVFNGALLGMFAGVSVQQGHGTVAFALIYGHGFLELTIIAISAAAGMRMGWAVVDPGNRPRLVALREESTAAVEIILGTIPFFIAAGLIEGFFTTAGFGPVAAAIVGTLSGGAYWCALLWRGKFHRRSSRPGALPAEIVC